MADSIKRRKLNDGFYKISKLSPRLRHWKIRAKVIESLTPNEQQKTYRNKKGTGRKCIYLLGDDSAKIKLLSFDKHAERLESLQINEEYYISGVKLQLSNKNYHSYNEYELIVNKDTVIEPVDGAGHLPCTSVQVGEKDTKKTKIQLTPIPLKQVHEDFKSEKHFDVMGIIKKSSIPHFKQLEDGTFYWKMISLIDTTGEISIKVSADTKKELKKVTGLKNQVIGFVGCVWKDYDKECIYAKLGNLCEEKELLGNLKVKVQNLNEWWCTQQKRSTRKRPAPSEKKSLLESAVSDPVQDPEIVPSKKMKIESNKSLTRSKANPVSTRLASTHPFSKGTHNQKCVLSSEIKAEVSRSVGLIYIDNKPAGTGFRVGEMYIITCVHVLEISKVFTTRPHFIACNRMAIEFDRKKFNQRENPLQIFLFQSDIAYLDEEHDFVVLKLQCHQARVGFPPPLTCFGEVSKAEIHLVGHPNGREMKEDDIFPYWSPEHGDKIRKLGNWSKDFFPDKKDYYSILLEPPRKILFDTTFDHGSSGSPGVMIRDDKPCVVLMLAGGTPKFIYDNPYSTLKVEDCEKVEYGFPISDIFKKMWNSPKQNDKDLASNIFKEFI